MLRITAPDMTSFETACRLLDEAGVDYFHCAELLSIVLYPADHGTHVPPLTMMEQFGCTIVVAGMVVGAA